MSTTNNWSVTYDPSITTQPYTISYPNITTGTSYTYTSPTWADTISITDGNSSPGSLQVKGDAHFNGDVTIKGKSIADSLERIEERLAILRPNEELEEKWDNLRALGQAYRELEKEIIEKQEMWAILKK